MLVYLDLLLDDCIEERTFRGWPMLAVSLILYPLITMLVLLGEFLINLKAIFHRESFILEQFEGLANYLIYVTPFLLSIAVFDWKVHLAALLFVSGCNQAHKVMHGET